MRKLITKLLLDNEARASGTPITTWSRYVLATRQYDKSETPRFIVGLRHSPPRMSFGLSSYAGSISCRLTAVFTSRLLWPVHRCSQ